MFCFYNININSGRQIPVNVLLMIEPKYSIDRIVDGNGLSIYKLYIFDISD